MPGLRSSYVRITELLPTRARAYKDMCRLYTVFSINYDNRKKDACRTVPPLAAVRAVCDIFDYFVSRGHEVQLAGFSRGGFAVLNLMTLIGKYLPNRCNVMAAAAFFHTDHKQHKLDAPIVA